MPRRHEPRLTVEHYRHFRQNGGGLQVYHGTQAGGGLFSSLLGIGKSLVSSAIPHLMPGLQAAGNQLANTGKAAAAQALAQGTDRLTGAVQAQLNKAVNRGRPF